MKNIGGLRVQGGIYPVKLDSRVLKSGSGADVSAQNGGTGNHIGELPAHPHYFIRVTDAFKIKATSNAPFRMFRRNHERFVTWAETRFDDQSPIAADG